LVKGLVEDCQDNYEAGLTTDLISNALDKVNWLEIVELS
jgi:hypothetical protein